MVLFSSTPKRNWNNRQRVSALLLLSLFAASSCSSSFKGGPDRFATEGSTSSFLTLGYSASRYSEYRSSTGAERQKLRNSIVLSTMGTMDLAYGKFEQQLTSERQGIPLLATTTSLALSATSTVLGNETTKAGLAAADTFVKGTKEAYDKDVLANQTIGFLQTQMRANRSAVRSRIIRLLSELDEAYPLELALADLEEYYAAGTITGGLIGINTQAAESLAASDAVRVETVTRYGPTDATAIIRQALKQGGNRAKVTLQIWLKSHNIDVPLATFLNSAEYAKHRDAYAATL